MTVIEDAAALWLALVLGMVIGWWLRGDFNAASSGGTIDLIGAKQHRIEVTMHGDASQIEAALAAAGRVERVRRLA